MHAKLFAKLQEVMQDFLDDNYEEDEWPKTWVHENAALHMAKSAEAVFDSMVESSQFTEEQEQ